MAGRWKFEEDLFLFNYFDAVGDYVGVHDLGRPKNSATNRVKFLKQSGAWEALERRKAATEDYRRIAGVPSFYNETR